MEKIIQLVEVAIAIPGVLAFFWLLILQISKTCNLEVKIIKDNRNELTAVTKITNASSSKKFENAMLIISPEHEEVLESGRKLAGELGLDGEGITDLLKLNDLTSGRSVYYNRQYALIPLNGYYDQDSPHLGSNFEFSCSIDKNKFRSGVFSVHLLLFKGSSIKAAQTIFRLG